MSRIAGLLMLWLVTACLTVGLPLQSVSAAIAQMLGSRHAHRTPEPSRQAEDPMAGWKDFRRADHSHGASTGMPAHTHFHETGSRHHHDAVDESVINLEAPADRDGGPAEILQAGASFVFVAAEGLAQIPQPIEAIEDAWQTLPAQPFSSQYPRRIERPPQAVS